MTHVTDVTPYPCDRCDIFHMWHIWHLVQELHRHVWLEGWLKLQITGTGATGPPSEETSRIKNPRRFSIKLSQAQNSQKSWRHFENCMLTKKVKNSEKCVVEGLDVASAGWSLASWSERKRWWLMPASIFCTCASTSSLFWEYNWNSMFDGPVCL